MKKIVAWIGAEANQVSLLNKISQRFPLAGLVIEQKKLKRKYSAGKIFRRIYEKIFLAEINEAWFKMLDHHKKQFQTLPQNIPALIAENINAEEVLKFTNEIQPDLIIISGTRLIKEKMFSLNPAVGFINLHTGLSPYIKGGPNCTNWCIANNELHLIGNTIMWLDKGIDSGNIIATDTVKFSGNESLSDIHIGVMEHAHDLYISAINEIIKDKNSVPSVKQENISKGKTYYTKNWNLKQKRLLLKNMNRFNENVQSIDYLKKLSEVVLVKLK